MLLSIGKRIKEIRISKNITQDELALKIGTTKQTIYKYENEIVTNIPSQKIELISNALNTTPDYLMGWSDKSTDDLYSIPGINPIPKTYKRPRLGTIACGEPILA